jgi:murein L,D-transpeptidase YcbB/YkuD
MRVPHPAFPLLANALALSLALPACSLRGNDSPPPELAKALRSRLTARTAPRFVERGADSRPWKALLRFYKRRGNQPVWFTRGGVREDAREVLAIKAAAPLEGLDPSDYDLGPAAALLDKRDAWKRDPQASAEAELRLSYVLLKYGMHLLEGRVDPRRLDALWLGQPRRVELSGLLEGALGGRGVAVTLGELSPRHQQYTLLKQALQRYHASAGGGAPETAADERKGAPTAPAVPAAERIRKLELNLERWRWLPESLGERYIMVNIPDFKLQAFEQGRVALEMRVVVGTREQPTPIFSDQMTHIVFSPYWNVPRGIAREETLPAVLRDPDYLRKNDLEIVRNGRVVDPSQVDWEAEEPDFRFRQRPGARNSLGLVKFMFPNMFDVYMHDTPADSLFRHASRDFSHGCVRVEKPLELAQWVLSGQPEWTREQITEAMHAGVEKHLKIARPVPVYLVYQTAWAAQDGSVRFSEDLYGHDAAQLALLDAIDDRAGGG